MIAENLNPTIKSISELFLKGQHIIESCIWRDYNYLIQITIDVSNLPWLATSLREFQLRYMFNWCRIWEHFVSRKGYLAFYSYFDGASVLERHNFIINALELSVSCTNLSIFQTTYSNPQLIVDYLCVKGAKIRVNIGSVNGLLPGAFTTEHYHQMCTWTYIYGPCSMCSWFYF